MCASKTTAIGSGAPYRRIASKSGVRRSFVCVPGVRCAGGGRVGPAPHTGAPELSGWSLASDDRGRMIRRADCAFCTRECGSPIGRGTYFSGTCLVSVPPRVEPMVTVTFPSPFTRHATRFVSPGLSQSISIAARWRG
jgi:hypothetical protein